MVTSTCGNVAVNVRFVDYQAMKAADDLRKFAQEMYEGKPSSLTESDLRNIDFYLRLTASRVSVAGSTST